MHPRERGERGEKKWKKFQVRQVLCSLCYIFFLFLSVCSVSLKDIKRSTREGEGEWRDSWVRERSMNARTKQNRRKREAVTLQCFTCLAGTGKGQKKWSRENETQRRRRKRRRRHTSPSHKPLTQATFICARNLEKSNAPIAWESYTSSWP